MSSFSTKTYDVFISFRGEDTRRNFTSHLYSALCQAGIKTYIDVNLAKGDTVWPALSQAIQNSDIAVVVFSRNYASSKWCLKELVKILKCRKSEGQVVIPVFYKVDPSDIRKQSGCYGKAFTKHGRDLGERYDNEYVQKKLSKWKTALTEAANISGWDSCNRDYKNDSQVIKQIIEDVLQKLYLRYPIELEGEGLVGTDKICEYFEFLLSRNKHNQIPKKVKVIGVWGMGGIGKTTIAKVVFSQFFPQHDSVCFLENIREESKRLGLASLRDKLLFDLLKDDNPKPNRIGSTLIARRLSNKKVFIVLDDVDSLDQLDDLCSVYKYVGSDSKIIITTRNRHLLSGRVDEIYKADVWSFHDSLELFCLHAFKQRFPQEGYEDLLKTAVHYAGGVPLALKVLGSNLHSRSIEFWDSELKKLKNYPCHNILNVLQVSFDGLDIPQQKIFLDIAFFFKDEDKGFVERILNASDFSATSGIAVLEEKALITISKGKRIQMHDFIQEMGLNIVRQGIGYPGKRSRLRDIGEVYDVLQNKKGSDAVEGITLDLSSIDDLLSLSADTFNMMTYLRFLKLYIPWGKRSGKVNYPRTLDKISDKLRYLEWHGYRLKHLPSTFCAKMLVEIRMPHSHVTELWQGVQDVVNLEVIDLYECTQLKSLPDLSKASKLKRMYLAGCESLLAVHPSVLSLDTLETLMLERCIKLKNLKNDKRLSSLWNVSINGCTGIREFSMSSDSMTNFDLSNTGIENLQSSIRNLPNHTLKYLAISNFRAVLEKQKLYVLFDGLASLIRLDLKDCCKISELPDNISNLSCLYELRLDGSSIERLPDSIKHLHYLRILSIKNCRKLRYLPELPRNFRELNAANCSSLVTLSPFMFLGPLYTYHYKYMSFKNCMKLDGYRVMEILLMMRTLFHNSVMVCLPGSKVPRQFTYQTTKSSFTITLPPKDGLHGIMLSVVLSPSEELKKHGAIIWCQCYLDGIEVELPSSTLDPNAWYHKAITELNSDHVFIWCDIDHFNSIYEGHGHQVSFEFYVTNDKKEHEVLDICPKECGVHFIFDSEGLHQSQHRETLTTSETPDEKECNDQNNHEHNFSKKCCSVNCLSAIGKYSMIKKGHDKKECLKVFMEENSWDLEGDSCSNATRKLLV